MGRFEEFELNIRKIRNFPLTYEAQIPSECSFFQDVRRYQSVSSKLEVRVINVDGIITLEPDTTPVPMSKLTMVEKKEFVEYLKIRVTRGDNIGSSWAFFRPQDKKKPVIAYGANIVHRDADTGQDRARELLHLLQGNKIKIRNLKQTLTILAVFLAVVLGSAGVYKYFYIEGRFPFKSIGKTLDSPEMIFYKTVFPQVFEWKKDDRPFTRKIAEDLLRPEYVTHILRSMDQEFYREEKTKDDNRGYRLALFAYFNYNRDVAAAMERHETKLKGTQFERLANIYSCRESGYTSNIFYFKVGDLNLKPAEISKILTENMVTYRDYIKLRDADEFSDLLEKDGISYKLKSFLEDVYTFTPLRITAPLKDMEWYLLTRTDAGGDMDFSAFFRQDKATMIPRQTGELLLNGQTPENFSWFGITEAQAAELKLSDASLTSFTKTMGQGLKLEALNAKISSLGLKPTKKPMDVTVHRELLMGDSKGKYGIKCYDPITSLVLSNLISKSSFEHDNNLSLKRDPIQVNTTLVQLSKDDGFSTQSVTITPGRYGLIKLFEPLKSFRGTLNNGQTVTFEKATANLFNPFSFMVFKESISLSFKHDITDMGIDLGADQLKIVKSSDGNYQIVQN